MQTNYSSPASRGIKSWAEDDRPREKLLNKSTKALSDAELLALIIGSGSARQTSVELSREILSSVSHKLSELATLGVNELMRFKGIGQAKATNIVAAMELGRRRRLCEGLARKSILNSKDAYEIIGPLIGDLVHEEFWLILMNRANRVLTTLRISEGSVAGTVADPKKIFKLALERNASAVILCHNHPSGNTQPSLSDKRITEKCREAGLFLDIPVFDHIVVANHSYFSFADQQLL